MKGSISRTPAKKEYTFKSVWIILHTICRMCKDVRSATSISIFRLHQDVRYPIRSELGNLAMDTVCLTLQKTKRSLIFSRYKNSVFTVTVTLPDQKPVKKIGGMSGSILMFNGLISFARLNFANGNSRLARKMRTSKCIKIVKGSR